MGTMPDHREKKSSPTFDGFAQRLRDLRQQRGFKQTELAQLAGVNNGNLSRYERGSAQPSAEVLRRLADSLGVSVAYLIEGEPSGLSPSLPDPELRQHLQELERLPDEDRQVIKSLIEAFLFRRRIQDIASPGASSQKAG